MTGGALNGTAASVNETPILRLDGVTKSFGSVLALADVTFDVRPGEVHALVGENGAGKSTLMAVTSGALRTDAGTVVFGGVSCEGATPRQMSELGIAIAHQHPALLGDLTVTENLVLGVPDEVRPSMRRAKRWARKVLLANDLDISPTTRVANLDLAQRHLLEIAKALAAAPKLLILDEPTEPLSAQETTALFDRIRSTTAAGVAVIYISHRLRDVEQIADRITILRDGEVRGTFDARDLTEEEILRLVVGRAVETAFPPKNRVMGDTALLSVAGLAAESLSSVDLDVFPGEVVGLAGIEGNGQREFMRALGGAVDSTGVVRVGGRVVAAATPAEAIAAGIVYLPGDRHAEGLMMAMSIRENMTLQAVSEMASVGVVSRERELAAVGQLREQLGIKMTSAEAPVSSLSGGNQQKSLLARALLAEPKVLLADEPTQGVDAGARFDLYRELRGLAASGAAVVILSSDAVELEGLCDRVLVFSRGSVVEELAGDDVSEANIARAAVTANSTRVRSNTTTSPRSRLSGFLRGEYAAGALLVVVALGLGIYTASKNASYLSEVNFQNYLHLAAVLGFVALAQSITVLSGGIDLSVGPLIGLCTVVASFWMTSSGPAALLGLAMLVLVAFGVGTVNGLVVTKLEITPVIATLVTFFSLQGISLLIRQTAGGRVSPRLGDLTSSALWFIPAGFLLLLGAVLVAEYLLRFSMWGLRLRALGSDSEIAHRVGVNIHRTTLGAYVACALLTLVGALLLMSLTGVGDPRAGISFTLSSIAAVVLGGVAVAGGRGAFLGVAAGALVLQQTTNASTFLRLDSSWQPWLVGALTLAAATLYSTVGRIESRT